MEANFAAFPCFLAVAVIAFSDSACAGPLAPGNGDALSLADSLAPRARNDRKGVVRPALDLVASQVLTAYHVARKRKAIGPMRHDQGATQPASPASRHDDLDDGALLDF